MKIKWNKYTWYSKMLAVVFFIGVMPVLSFYIGTQYQGALYDADYVTPSELGNSIANHHPSTATSTDSGNPSQPSQGKIVTQADNMGTVHLSVGQTFLLKLGEMTWDLSISDPSVISRVKNVMVVRGAQGIYTGVKPGTTILTATGSPACDPGKACSMLRVAFKVTIVVDQPASAGKSSKPAQGVYLQ